VSITRPLPSPGRWIIIIVFVLFILLLLLDELLLEGAEERVAGGDARLVRRLGFASGP
jgi:hypothetical protein